MRRILFTLMTMALVICTLHTVAKASDVDEQQAVARKFITAYFSQDMRGVRECLPVKPESMFARYPLTAPPFLAEPRVHKNQALVEFAAVLNDNKFPAKGGLILYYHEGIWRVRQVIFYDKVPRLFGLPSKSVTSVDRAQEASVQAVSQEFMKHWRANDFTGMLSLWHNWPITNPERVKGLTFGNITSTVARTRWNDVLVSCAMTVTYHRFFASLSMNAKVGVILVKENGVWKVRGNHFVFDF
jgi:hypothetical protein